MYNKRKYNKINDKKVLHKIKKQWVVLSLSMLAMIGAGGAIATQTHASTVNTPQVQQEKQVAPQQTPSSDKNSTSAKPVINLSAQAQKAPVSTTNNGNKGKQLSLSDDASSAVHQTPSIDDIISAVDSNTWNSQYGFKYIDLLSKLKYNDIHVLDNPTAYNNYTYGNTNVPQNTIYRNNLAVMQVELNAFAAYPKVQVFQNLMNSPINQPSSYSSVVSNPLFNGFETTFNNNDITNYDSVLDDFISLEADRNNDSAQASDLQNALSGLNSLSANAKEAVTKFYGISPFDISNEIDRLNSGYTPQEMVYQPIELKYYDVASKSDPNANNENVAVSRTPVKVVTLNESDFGNANPNTLIPNPHFNFNDKYSNSNYYNAPFIANSNLQVPNGYFWTGLNSSDIEGSTINGLYIPGLNSDEDKDSYIKSHPNLSKPTYYDPTQQQLHFHLVPRSEASQPEAIVAYVRTNNNVDDISNNTNNAFSISWLHQHGTELYKGPSNDLADGVWGVYYNDSLFIGGDFYQYCIDNNNRLNDGKSPVHLIPDSMKNNVNSIFLEDSKGLNGAGFNNSGNCSYMFSNLPNLMSVYRDGFFGANDTKDNINNSASDISYMFANDPKLLLIENNNPSSWDFDNGCIADNVFYNDPMLNDITGLSKWNTTGFVSMNHMFDGDKNLSDYSPVSNWDVGGVSQMNYTFANAESADHGGFTDANLEQLVPWNLRQITSAEGLFEGDMWIDNISSWMNKPIGTGNEYPDVKDAFKNTGFSLANNALTSTHPAWVPLNSGSVDQELDGSWIPKMYRTENGNYSFTPDSNVIYLGDPFHGISATYYKKDNYLLISSNDYTIGILNNIVYTEQENNILPSRDQLLNDLKLNGIDPNNINSIGLIGKFGAPSLTNGSLNHYFSNLPNLRSITFGDYSDIEDAYDYRGTTIQCPVDVKGLFANDPKLDSVIGFFGNEQALESDPYTGFQSTGLIHKLTFNGNTPVVTPNLFEDATSTACMFDGDRSLFTNDNAKANIDAISSIPMDNITDASYMFRNTGLNDSNIVTNWDLSKLQYADDMFAGCNLTNLNGFSKLGDWTNKHYYVPSRPNPAGDGEPTADANGVQDGYSDNSSDKVTKVVPNKLQSASYMFANNPHLTDLSGISGNNIDINPITNVSHMFDGDTDLTDVSSIENGNNNWRFNQQPNVSDMFSNTNVGYDAPKVENNYGQFILGAMPKQDTDHIIFNDDSSKNTTVHGDDGTTSNVIAPQGYHFINGSNGQFTFNHGTHTFNVAPDTMAVPVEFKDTTNGSFLDLNPNANGLFTVNKRGTISFSNDVLYELQDEGYQLSQSNNYSFIVKPHEVRSDGTLYPGYEPTFNVDPIPATSTIEYEYNGHDVTDNASTKSVTGDQSVGKTTFDLASLTVPNGYQLSANNPATDAYSNNHVVVNVTPIQATDNIVYKNGYQVVSGDSNSTNSVTGNKFVTPNSFNTSNLVLPNGYELAGNGNDNIYDGNTVEVQVVPKPTTTTIHYEYNGHPLTEVTKQGSYNGSFDTDSLGLPNGYNLADGNQTISDNNANVNVDLVPQQKMDTINFVDSQGVVSTSYVFGDSSATGLDSSYFTVGNTPNGLPSGYQVEDPSQVINYDGGNHTIMIKPIVQPTPSHTSGNTPSNKPSVNPTPNHKSGNTPNNKPSVNPTPSHTSDNTPNNKPSVNPTPSHTSDNTPNNKPSVNPTPSHKSGNTPSNKPNVTPTPSHKSGNTPNNNPSVNPTPNHTSGNKPNNTPSVNPTPSHKSGNTPNNTPNVNPVPSNKSGNTPSNKPSVNPTPSHKSGNTPNNKPSVNPTPSHTSDNTPSNKPSVNPTPNHKSGNTPNNKPSVNPTPSHKSGNTPNNTPSVNPVPSNKSGNTPSNKPSVTPTPSHKSGNKPNNTPSVNPTPGNTPNNTPSVNPTPSHTSDNTPNNTPSVNPTPSVVPTPNPSGNIPNVNPQPSPQPAAPTNSNAPVSPVMPSTSTSSSANNVPATSTTTYVSPSVSPESTSSEPVAESSNFGTPSENKVATKYAKVAKAIFLHTNRNFTKRNAVSVVKPGIIFKVEKSVKARNGARRYEVEYNKKNYFITASKRSVNVYYKTAKHANNSVNNYIHYRYAKVIKALQLHTTAKFTKRNGIKVVRPGAEFRINRIVKNRGLVRYEIRYQSHNYFITANHNYTVNAYLQKYNFRKHGYKSVRVIKPLNEYRKLSFTKRNSIRHFTRGSVLPIKKVITIAKGEVTRLQLTNGHYVTANKDFVEVIK